MYSAIADPFWSRLVYFSSYERCQSQMAGLFRGAELTFAVYETVEEVAMIATGAKNRLGGGLRV